ncbi:MAG: ADP-glyceromanno-heptose 6-epimerase [Rickettsiales bacterium]
MKTILVTGGGGFIGSNLVAELLNSNSYKVVICDRFGADSKWRNLSKHPVYDVITPENLFSWLDKNAENIEIIYHLGAVSSTTEEKVDLILANNFTFSVELWDWCVKNKTRFIYTSSSATYGNGENGFDDSMDLSYLSSLVPLSAYGWSKHLFDNHVARVLANDEVVPPQWVNFKLFNVYGPNEYHKGNQCSVISQIATHAIEHSSVKLFRSYNDEYEDGEQKRDMIYVKDAVKVLLWCLITPKVSGMFNLGSGKASSFNEMTAAIFEAIGHEGRISYIDMPEKLVKNYQYFTQANIDRLKNSGFHTSFTPLSEGIKDYVQNYLLKENKYL